MEDSTCVSCGHCATVCPTGSLVEKGIEDATTIPLPGFTQKNSVGKTIESSGKSKGPMTPKKRRSKSKSESGSPASDGGAPTDARDGTDASEATDTGIDPDADPVPDAGADPWTDDHDSGGGWP
jgi:formate dehydrogenase major subunit